MLGCLAKGGMPMHGAYQHQHVTTDNFNVCLWREIRSDRWFYAATFIYVLSAGSLAVWLGADEFWQPLLYLEAVLTQTSALLAAAVIIYSVIRGIIRAPRAPLEGAFASLRDLLTSSTARAARVCAGVLMIATFAVFMGAFTSIKTMLPHVKPFDWDVRLADLDRALHGGIDPGPALASLLGPHVTAAIDWFYAEGWALALVGMSFWAAVSVNNAHLRRRYFITLCASWIILGNIAAGIFLSGGPAFYEGMTGDSTRFSEFLAGFEGRAAQFRSYLWSLHTTGQMDVGNGISAFPSIHVAFATLVALFLGAVSRVLGFIGLAFLIAVQVGSVLLGWHYAIDGYASIAATIALWWLAGRSRLGLGHSRQAVASGAA